MPNVSHNHPKDGGGNGEPIRLSSVSDRLGPATPARQRPDHRSNLSRERQTSGEGCRTARHTSQQRPRPGHNNALPTETPSKRPRPPAMRTAGDLHHGEPMRRALPAAVDPQEAARPRGRVRRLASLAGLRGDAGRRTVSQYARAHAQQHTHNTHACTHACRTHVRTGYEHGLGRWSWSPRRAELERDL